MTSAAFLLLALLSSAEPAPPQTVEFVVPDSEQETAPLVRAAVASGRKKVEAYFGRPFPRPFTVVILPSRDAMNAEFARRWATPATACWMVAAGVADRLFVLSPRLWKSEACEHEPAPAHVAEIVEHEVVHVFHAQSAKSPQFDGMDELAWFVEGLATVVSGQLDGSHAGDAAAALAEGKGPADLATAWTGRYRYGVSGSLVRFVAQSYGGAMIERLIRAGSNGEVLAVLGTSEEAFLAAWRKSVRPAKVSPR